MDRPGRPKVAYVMSRFPKLSETFVLGEILAVEEHGVEVKLFPLLREREEVDSSRGGGTERASQVPAVPLRADPA